jgi:predicted phosphodiesterase
MLFGMRLVFASDTHARHASLHVPDGDVFIHCGDLTMGGKLSDISAFGTWVHALPHQHKIVIAGNHDFAFERSPERAREALGEGTHGLAYLEDSALSLEGLKLYGSPYQPWFYDWAFNLQRGPQLAAKWSAIPNDTDVLITHGPPMWIRDEVRGDHVGCADLWNRVAQIRPLVHAFGHIHEGSGVAERDGIYFINASICDAGYQPVHPCRVVDIDLATRRVEIVARNVSGLPDT